jgi:serine/threonine protein kinase
VADALIAKEFAGYRIDSLVGRGGMGVVYRATDLSLDRTVALKVLDDELAKDPDFRRRFVTESKLAASLDHPNVIPIYAAGECDGMPYIAMRYVGGEDLRAVLRTAGRLEPARAARMVAQLASALDAAHEAGLVHRDVKPANVLVAKDDHVYLTDFGLTKRVAADTEATKTGVVLGTLNYMAPEQIRGQAIGPFTDVYSLGCMIVHLLTGQVPYPVEADEAKLWAHVAEPPPRPSERVEGLGEAFDPVVARAMGKRPEDRFATAGEVGAAMTAAARAEPPPAPAPAPAPARVPAAPAAPSRRDLLLAAAREPFSVVMLGVLLVTAIALGQVALGVPLALAVYGLAVLRSYKDPDTARRLAPPG